MINFILGFALGCFAGFLLMHLVHEYIEKALPEDNEASWLGGKK